MEPLLKTKLFIPAAPGEIVARTSLIARMDKALQHRLTLLSAPAGFGKTTLISAWLDQLKQTAGDPPPKIAWLALDEGDSDPQRFAAYIIAALESAGALEPAIAREISESLKTPRPFSLRSPLTAVINELIDESSPILLLLDDVHLVDHEDIHAGIDFLIENMPPCMHLLLSTREDPLLSLARLRVRAQMHEIRAADLRFTDEEAADFLNRVMGLDLSGEDIAALSLRTEGWVAGLQLAALTLRNQPNPSELIRSFTGSSRMVLDYLIEEVLERQPEDIQRFLVRTAILSRFTGPLCDALREANPTRSGAEILETLDRANLFVVPLDGERTWYRYHHLFADLLRHRLKVTARDQIDGLHHRAAAWFENQGLLTEAVRHAIAANDFHTAVRLIEKGALAALERSDFGFIFNAVDRLPDGILHTAHWLFVYHLWALTLTGQIATAAPKLADTDWLHEAVSANPEESRRMTGYLAGLREQISGWQQDYRLMARYAREAAANLPADHWILAYCEMGTGVAAWGSGDLSTAKQAFGKAFEIGKQKGNRRVEMAGANYLGHTLELRGRLNEAVRHFEKAFELVTVEGRLLPVAFYVQIELARVLYEQGRLQEAEQHLEKGIAFCRRLADGRVEKIGHYILARIRMAEGDFKGAAACIRDGDRAHTGIGSPVDMRDTEHPQVRLWLRQGKLDRAGDWLAEHNRDLDAVTHFKTRLTHTMQARVMIACSQTTGGGGYLDSAAELLDQLWALAAEKGWGKKQIEILALQALLFDLAGEADRSLEKLETALLLGEPEDFVRSFIDEGRHMARLLYRALEAGIAPKYVRRLLAAFPSEAADLKGQAPIETADGEWIEPLSEREVEVLELIATGMTNPEVAEQLYLSLNTVKAHTRNIYGKLGVSNRTQAVGKAQALGMLVKA